MIPELDCCLNRSGARLGTPLLTPGSNEDCGIRAGLVYGLKEGCPRTPAPGNRKNGSRRMDEFFSLRGRRPETRGGGGGLPGEYVVTGAWRREVAAAFGGKAESAEPTERTGPEQWVVVIRLKALSGFAPASDSKVCLVRE